MKEIELVPRPVPILTDGLQASRTVGEGRWIPILVLDLADRPDVREMLRHRPDQRGEVRSRWGVLKDYPRAHLLIVEFQRPVRGKFHILFDAVSQGILIDYALDSEAVYLQSGKPGDRVPDLTEAPRLLIEVPATEEIKERWEAAFLRAMTKEARRRGLARRPAKKAAVKMISEVRKIRELRMKPRC